MKNKITYMNILEIGLMFFAIFYLSYCVLPDGNPKPAIIEKPVELTKQIYAWDSVINGSRYTDLTYKALNKFGDKLLSVDNLTDTNDYCSKFNKLNKDERLIFFTALISAMAKEESNFRDNEKYTEGFNDVSGNAVVSRGLLQISQESANQKAYGCAIASANDLHDSETNLNCAVKILNYWIPKDHVIGSDKLGGARYWAALRQGNSKDYVMKTTKNLSICK